MKHPTDLVFTVNRDWSLRQYWKARLDLHHWDMYKGRRMAKMPEDLRVYEHIIEATRPEVIVELGSGNGTSALWFADRLDIFCGKGSVISIDLEGVTLEDERITFLRRDLRDASDEVASLVDGRVTMVIEDSKHDYATTLAALRLYSPLVQKGQFFVVEDTVIDEPDLTIFGDRGVKPAIDAFLAEESRFVRQPLDVYGLTMHMGGWLEAVA